MLLFYDVQTYNMKSTVTEIEKLISQQWKNGKFLMHYCDIIYLVREQKKFNLPIHAFCRFADILTCQSTDVISNITLSPSRP